MQQRTIADLHGQRDRPRRHADVDRGPARRERSIATIHAALDAGVTLIDTADAYHLHARRGRPQRGAHRRGPALVGRRHRPACSSRPRAATCAPATARGRSTADPAYLKQAARDVAQAPRRRRDRALPVPPPRPEGALRRVGRRARRAARRGRHRAWPASRTPTVGADPTRPTRCSAAGWCRCRTSSRRRSAPASPSSSSAPSSASRSCRGARSAASRKAGELGHDARGRSPRSREAHGVSPQQVALAWELALADVVIPIPGASRPEIDPRLGRGGRPALTADELAA